MTAPPVHSFFVCDHDRPTLSKLQLSMTHKCTTGIKMTLLMHLTPILFLTGILLLLNLFGSRSLCFCEFAVQFASLVSFKFAFFFPPCFLQAPFLWHALQVLCLLHSFGIPENVASTSTILLCSAWPAMRLYMSVLRKWELWPRQQHKSFWTAQLHEACIVPAWSCFWKWGWKIPLLPLGVCYPSV